MPSSISMSTLIAYPVKFITDGKGKRQEVVVPFQVWKNLTAELEELREKQRILLGLRQACRQAKAQERGALSEQDLAEPNRKRKAVASIEQILELTRSSSSSWAESVIADLENRV